MTAKHLSTLVRKSVIISGFPVDWIAINSKINFKNLILIIPGNPGLVSFYEQFMFDLFENLEGNYSIWCISHTGHSIIEPTPGGYLCNLENEINHKVEFIKKYVQRDSNLSMIGHSIGCYMILEALNKLQPNLQGKITYSNDESSLCEFNLKKNYLLFPTIERMKESPNGKSKWPVLKYFRYLAIFLAWFLNLLPTSIKMYIINWSLDNQAIPMCCREACLFLVDPKVLNNIMKLAYDELCNVCKLKVDIITKLKYYLAFYYGANDKWCPLSYHNNLVENIPHIEAYICDKGIEHAFVLNSSTEMASILSEMIQCKNKVNAMS